MEICGAIRNEAYTKENYEEPLVLESHAKGSKILLGE